MFAATFVALAGCSGNDPAKSGKPLAAMQWVANEMGDMVKPGVAIGVKASCHGGMQPISGTGRYSATTGTEFLIEQSQPYQGGWLFSVRNQTDAPVQVKVKALALCGTGVPPAPDF